MDKKYRIGNIVSNMVTDDDDTCGGENFIIQILNHYIVY